MKPMDGLSLTRAIKVSQETKSIYVILVTADKDHQTMSAAFDAGVNDFISKPIHHDELNARILGARRTLSQHRQEGQEREEIRRQAFDLASEKRRIERTAATDPLTDLPNRRYASSRLNQEWATFGRYNRPLGILSLDLDQFKQINDNFGHDVGDKVLQHFARVLSQSIRSEDTACRMGGEEFIVIAPNTDLTTMRSLCERIRVRVEKQQPAELKLPRLVTVSIGATVADLDQDESWQNTLKRSDRALYEAKAAGRNCSVVTE
jgi:diguanylate cyclase (GGDEF)-like protein